MAYVVNIWLKSVPEQTLDASTFSVQNPTYYHCRPLRVGSSIRDVGCSAAGARRSLSGCHPRCLESFSSLPRCMDLGELGGDLSDLLFGRDRSCDFTGDAGIAGHQARVRQVPHGRLGHRLHIEVGDSGSAA